MNLNWTKTGDLYDREYTASGNRASYRIDLDRAADRWVIHVNGTACARNVFYITNAQKIVQMYEDSGRLGVPLGLRPRPDGGTPQILMQPDGSSASKPPPVIAMRTGLSSGPGTHLPVAVAEIATLLHDLTRSLGIVPDAAGTDWAPWKSAVYALVDCIFSAQTRYEAVVRPMLLNRLPGRPGLRDARELPFSAFIADIDSFGAQKFERYGELVLTRQVLAGRRKVEVCYDGATFFVARGLETMADLQAISPDCLERLILGDFQQAIRGVGPALARYLMILLGSEDHVKPDVMIRRFWDRLCIGPPRSDEAIRDVFRIAAAKMGTTPARLDHAIWQWESNQTRQ